MQKINSNGAARPAAAAVDSCASARKAGRGGVGPKKKSEAEKPRENRNSAEGLGEREEGEKERGKGGDSERAKNTAVSWPDKSALL